jgi:amidase
MTAIADGSDMGGSLRNPASFCNVVGLRPSYGRVPAWPNRTPWSGLGTSGVMARSVDDLALQLQVVAGPDARVPISLPEPGSAFAAVIDGPDLDLAGVRVAWTPDLGLPVDAEVRAALAHVPDRLTELGCAVTGDQPDLRGAADVFQTLRAWSFLVSYGAIDDDALGRVKDTVRWNLEFGRSLSLADHAAASARHARIVERVGAFFDRYDVLALPTAQVVPFDVELDWPRTVEGQPMETYIDWMRSCSDITVTGCPAVSMPAGFTPDGLPVGVQFVGRPRGDVELLRFAKQWERAEPIGSRRATFDAS